MDDAMNNRALGMGFVSSFLLHAAVMTAIVAIAGHTLHTPEKLTTIVLDAGGFTLDGGGGGKGKPAGKAMEPARKSACFPPATKHPRISRQPSEKGIAGELTTAASVPRSVPQTSKTAELAPAALPVALKSSDIMIDKADDRAIVETSSPEGSGFPPAENKSGGVGASVAQGQPGNGAGFGTGTGAQGAGAPGVGVAGGKTGGTAGGTTPVRTENSPVDMAKARYIKEQFRYIQRLIMGSIQYPAIAKRMGWQGSVTVSFIIVPSGHVENLRIVHGSGHKILDENAMRAIEKIQPFPKPPGRAEITIPIEYKLV